MNLLMKGAALAPPFSCTTKYSSDVYSPRPPDIRVRLLPTKPPVPFTTEQPDRDSRRQEAMLAIKKKFGKTLLDLVIAIPAAFVYACVAARGKAKKYKETATGSRKP